MSAQLTLQAPLELPPAEVTPYLDKLWDHGLEGSTGAATFTLIIWEPSWLEQQMVRIGRVDGPDQRSAQPGAAGRRPRVGA